MDKKHFGNYAPSLYAILRKIKKVAYRTKPVVPRKYYCEL